MNIEKQQEGVGGGKTPVKSKRKESRVIDWVVGILIAIAAAVIIVAMIIRH